MTQTQPSAEELRRLIPLLIQEKQDKFVEFEESVKAVIRAKDRLGMLEKLRKREADDGVHPCTL